MTFDELALSNPQGQGVVDAVPTPLHVSPTPAPSASIPTHLVTARPVPHASASGLSGLPTCGSPDCNDAAPLEIANDRPWPPHQDTRYLERAILRHRLSSAYSLLPPSKSCVQASPEPLARPLVAPSELNQVTDLLALFAVTDLLALFFWTCFFVSDRPLDLVFLHVAHSDYHALFRDGT